MSDAITQKHSESAREVELFKALNTVALALFDIKEIAALLLDLGDLDKEGVPGWNYAVVSMINERASNG